jgi:hypothetical protein
VIKRWWLRRWFRDAKEFAHADATMLAVHYWGTPVPFWPMDFPTALEGALDGAAASPAHD